MRHGIRLKGIKSVVKKNGQRYLYRRVGDQLVPLPNLPESHPELITAYVDAGKTIPKGRAADGLIAALITSHPGSPEYLRMAYSTRAVWRRTLGRITEQRGVALVKDLRADHLRKDIRAFSPGSAQNRLKAWRSILKFAVEEGWISSDPSIGIRAARGEVTPHRQWTDSEIAQYRAHWSKNTAERLAFEVIFWAGARCVDAVSLGWQKVDAQGWLSYVQAKDQGASNMPRFGASCLGRVDGRGSSIPALGITI